MPPFLDPQSVLCQRCASATYEFLSLPPTHPSSTRQASASIATHPNDILFRPCSLVYIATANYTTRSSGSCAIIVTHWKACERRSRALSEAKNEQERRRRPRRRRTIRKLGHRRRKYGGKTKACHGCADGQEEVSTTLFLVLLINELRDLHG